MIVELLLFLCSHILCITVFLYKPFFLLIIILESESYIYIYIHFLIVVLAYNYIDDIFHHMSIILQVDYI
ncbi:MAG: hypothetical protein ACKPKO_56680 [Candidatus Fonsibacter sp.]